MQRTTDAACAEAHSVFIRLVLGPYLVHFKSAGFMRETTLDILDKKVCKETLISTAQDPAVREAIGTDPRFWADFSALLRSAIPSLERRSFRIWDPSSVDYESTSGALIASHYPGLWRDLERLNDLLSIARNVLSAGAGSQDLAAVYGVDEEVCRLINCCIRVTARGFDGDAGTGDEEKWKWIVDAYKKLLIISLQFLNNHVARNERRKLMLWLYLFDNPTDPALAPDDIPETSSASLTDIPSNPSAKPSPPITDDDLLVAFGSNSNTRLDTSNAVSLLDDDQYTQFPPPSVTAEGTGKQEGNGYALFVKRTKKMTINDYLVEHQREPTLAEIYLDAPRRWAGIRGEDQRRWQDLYEDTVAKYRQDIAVYEAKMLAKDHSLQNPPADPGSPSRLELSRQEIISLESQLAQKFITRCTELPQLQSPTYRAAINRARDRPPVDDMRMLYTARSGTKILESGKSELMKRLEGYGRRQSFAPLPDVQSTDAVSGRHSATSADNSPDPRALAATVPRRSASLDSRNFTHTVAQPSFPERTRSPTTLHFTESTNAQAAVEGAIVRESGEEHLEDEEIDEQNHGVSEGRAEGHIEGDEEEEDEEEDDVEDYPGSTEDGRGLLTDVPLVLGPSEIEVLPMLIMSGIVPATDDTPKPGQPEKDSLVNLHTVRTHILLSQSNGRNLLRELLIFVAAWDLRDEELYFKFMVKIMEAILKSGLMPYAYHAFRDRSRSKDIISPAQAVIMKLLTCIFRARGEASKAAVVMNAQTSSTASTHGIASPSTSGGLTSPNMPSRVDLHILNFIFTEFRQHIIPQTCALIFLQGQIHAGRASPEDFPLNLWDMERMYEGVYQYLEFFAVLTEESIWKGILGEWEMASELVTLLRELEGGIPKMGPVSPRMLRRSSSLPQQKALSADAVSRSQSSIPVAIERPFETGVDPAPALAPFSTPQKSGPIFEAETPLAYPEDPALPSGHDLQHEHDEPSDFEWRNLKKLTVLVLSSLIWKNRTVQDQVRAYGGLETLVSCCKVDDNNPYIREHAIMCLRFAIEGCEENARRIQSMSTGQGQQNTKGSALFLENVPKEVLDTNLYETFMDPKGQIGLRRKDVPVPHAAPVGLGTSDANATRPRLSAPKMTAEKAAELMQNVLREFAPGDKIIPKDKQKAESLAKLDRAFEGCDPAAGEGQLKQN